MTFPFQSLACREAPISTESPSLATPASDMADTAADTAADARDGRWLMLWMAAFAALYLAFYPPIYTSIDEASNFGMAYVLRHGTIYPGRVGYSLAMSPIGPYGLVYRFPIGFSAMLALFSFAGWHLFFLLNPVLHLTATWFFGGIMRLLNRSRRWAIFYLFYPSFVLFSRTLFSDIFAASLTTLALYLIFRRRMILAGVCLGIALTARSASVLVACIMIVGMMGKDWRRRKQVAFWRGSTVQFLFGLLPLCCVNLLYNHFTMGSAFKSTYSAGELSLHGLEASGGLYLLSLMIVFPAMLIAPLVYRGLLWKECLAATTLVLGIVVSYNQSTYGNNLLQSLLSTPRQILPVLPFYLMTYCCVLAAAFAGTRRRLTPFFIPAGFCLLLVAAILSWQHQKYLHRLLTTRDAINRMLPSPCIVYANKDAFKLHQPVWDRNIYRELPIASPLQARNDFKSRPVYVILLTRARGFKDEDDFNLLARKDLATQFQMTPVRNAPGASVEAFHVVGLKR